MSLPVMGKDSCSVFPKILEQVNDVVGKFFFVCVFLSGDESFLVNRISVYKGGGYCLQHSE